MAHTENKPLIYTDASMVNMKREEGITEVCLQYDDENSISHVNSIAFEGVLIFHSHSKLSQKLSLEASDSPTIQMHFLLDGESTAWQKNGKKVHTFKSKQHNLIYNSSFEGVYTLESKIMQNFEIQFTEDFFRRFVNENSKSLNGFLEKIHKKEMAVIAPENMSITRLMQANIYQMMHCERKGYMKKLFLEAKVIEMLMLQLEQYEQNTHTSTTLKPQDVDKIHAVKTILEEHTLQSFTLMELARQVGLNDFKLKKGFKEIFGTTVFGYLSDLRMEHARHLLLEEKKTVAEAADATGFSQPHHFSAAFKKKFGYLPSKLKA